MAKAGRQPDGQAAESTPAASPVDVNNLAAELYVRNVIPRADVIQPWKVAADCFIAAQEFARVAALVNSGVCPRDVGPEVKTQPAVEAEPTESPATSQ